MTKSSSRDPALEEFPDFIQKGLEQSESEARSGGIDLLRDEPEFWQRSIPTKVVASIILVPLVTAIFVLAGALLALLSPILSIVMAVQVWQGKPAKISINFGEKNDD